MEEFLTVLSNFGFPVAVASYLLFRFEKKLEDLEQSNEDMRKVLNDLKEIVDQCPRRTRR